MLASTLVGKDVVPVAMSFEVVECDIRSMSLSSWRKRNMLDRELPVLKSLEMRPAVASLKSIYLLLMSTVPGIESLPVVIAVEADECDIKSIAFASCRHKNVLSLLPALAFLVTRLSVWSANSIYLLLLSTVMSRDRLLVVASLLPVEWEIRSRVLASCRHRNMLLRLPWLIRFVTRLPVVSRKRTYLLLVSAVSMLEQLVVKAEACTTCETMSTVLVLCRQMNMLVVQPALPTFVIRPAVTSFNSINRLLGSIVSVEVLLPDAAAVELVE